MAATANELYEKYRRYVKENPDKVSQLEAAARVISYLIPAKFEHSTVLSELLYSASSLLVLLNDTILRQTSKVRLKLTVGEAKLQSWLAVLESVEVFLELAASKMGGLTVHWIVVICIQIAKTALRFVLLKYYRTVQTCPAIPAMNRKKELHRNVSEDQMEDNIVFPAKEQRMVTFELVRSGRVVRTLVAAPPASQRSWKLPGSSIKETTVVETPTILNPTQIIGEGLHITRPLIHLLSMYLCGQQSWKPWLLACGTDLSSLFLMGDPSRYTTTEKEELKRRTMMMLFYLLRSPFYDQHTRFRLILLLQVLGQNIKGLSLITNPLIEYLPVWQKIYFYVWNI